MIDKLKEYDIVIGSRYVEGAKDDRTRNCAYFLVV